MRKAFGIPIGNMFEVVAVGDFVSPVYVYSLREQGDVFELYDDGRHKDFFPDDNIYANGEPEYRIVGLKHYVVRDSACHIVPITIFSPIEEN